MNEGPYMSRLCDADLQMALQSSGAVLIEGAKWCGKTRSYGHWQNFSHVATPDEPFWVPGIKRDCISARFVWWWSPQTPSS